jgi:protein dithiol:quinone oxidoreductase
MQTRTNVLPWPAGIMVAALLALAVALVAQHAFNVQPCPWCVLQRLLFLSIAIVSAIALWRSMQRYRIPIGGLVLILALLGIASAAWQHLVAARSTSCRLTLADKIVREHLHLDRLLPSVFQARGTCADAAVNLLGVPFEFWSLALFAAIGLASIQYMRRPIRT